MIEFHAQSQIKSEEAHNFLGLGVNLYLRIINCLFLFANLLKSFTTFY